MGKEHAERTKEGDAQCPTRQMGQGTEAARQILVVNNLLELSPLRTGRHRTAGSTAGTIFPGQWLSGAKNANDD